MSLFLVSMSNTSDSESFTKLKIRKIVTETLCNSLAQSVIKIVLIKDIVVKIFLSLFVLVSTSLASYLVIQSIMNYFTYSVTTSSRTIYETSTLFPKVTFCNYNWLSTQYAFDLIQMKMKWSEMTSLPMDQMKKLGHDLNDTLIECSFNSFKCNSTEFTWSYDEDYGNCYTFNSGKTMRVKESYLGGPNFGLQLTLYVNIYEKHLKTRKGLGAVIRIGNSSYQTDNSNNGIFVSPGYQTFIAVEREFKTMIEKPYSNCESMIDSDFYNLIARSDYAYTQQLCISQCLQKKFIDIYNCTLYYFVSLFNRSQCDSDIVYLITKSPESFDKNYINEICLPQCPLECNQTLYKTSISFNQLNGNYEYYILNLTNNPNLDMDFINITIDATTVKESLVKVNVFYESLSYTILTDSPQTDAVWLLSSIGGNLSLFLGVSVFSLFEFIIVTIEVFLILKNNYKLKKTFF